MVLTKKSTLFQTGDLGAQTDELFEFEPKFKQYEEELRQILEERKTG